MADPARRRTARPKRAEVREQVLTAAASVFARRGFDGASLDEVATEAGFTKGAVYSNFSSKDELFLALMDREVLRRIDVVTTLMADRDQHRELALVIGDQLGRAALEDPEWQLLFLTFWQRAIREPAFRGRFVQRRRELRAAIADVVHSAMTRREGQSDFSPSQLSIILLALSNGLAIEGLADTESNAGELFGPVLAKLISDGHPPGAPSAEVRTA